MISPLIFKMFSYNYVVTSYSTCHVVNTAGHNPAYDIMQRDAAPF